MTNICTILFFSKNRANTETHSFADIYAIRILDEGNYDSSPVELAELSMRKDYVSLTFIKSKIK